jgi:Tfp pilus assembly protein PilO
MSEHLYLISMAVVFGTPLAIFGMKYWAAAHQATARTAEEGAYRKLAAAAVTAQSGNAATLSAIQSELAEIKTRVASVEKILKAVE